MTAPNWPTIALNHLGFRPRAGQKVLVVRALATPRPTQFTLRDVSERPFHFTRPLNGVASASDFGPCLMADFTDVDRGAVEVGMDMRMVFRIKERDAQRGFVRYFWKAAPAPPAPAPAPAQPKSEA